MSNITRRADLALVHHRNVISSLYDVETLNSLVTNGALDTAGGYGAEAHGHRLFAYLYLIRHRRLKWLLMNQRHKDRSNA